MYERGRTEKASVGTGWASTRLGREACITEISGGEGTIATEVRVALSVGQWLNVGTMSRGMDCIFCRPNRPILAETKLSLAVLDGFPVSRGHTLVIPKRHVESLWDMTTEESTDAFALVRQVKNMLQEEFNPQGFNVGVNCGQAAGQSIFHAHIHLIPRYTGDVANPRGGIRNIIPGKGNY